MDRKTYPNPKVVGLASKIVTAKLDVAVTQNAELAQKLGVSVTPTIMFLDGAGKKVKTLEGYKPPDELAKEMQSLIPGPVHTSGSRSRPAAHISHKTH